MATYDKEMMVLNAAGNYDKHHVETNANQVVGLGVSTLNNTTYAVGDVVYSTDNLKCQFRCTQAGTTDVTNRPDYAGASVGDTITDGTAKFVAEYRQTGVLTINSKAPNAHGELTLNFSDVENKPTTLIGYGVTDPKAADNLSPLIYASAAAHNAIYRGKYLGTSVTAAQWAAIKAGTFDDLYIGDYWTIGGVDYVIAAFDYYLNTCWSPTVTAHHVTIVPRKNMYTHVMNDTNTTAGAYVGSKMYQSGLNNAKTAIANAFGSAHILTIRQFFQNAVTDGYETGQEWYDASVWLMNEFNVYGSLVWKNAYASTNWRCNYTIDNSQYPVFIYDKTMIHTHEDYWLRDVAGSDAFAGVGCDGYCGITSASDAFGVRPAFNIYQS